MEPIVVMNRNIIEIEEDVKDYSRPVDQTSRTHITLYRVGERCGMHIDQKSLPIADYQEQKLPSGDVRIAVIMEFPRDSTYFAGEYKESP